MASTAGKMLHALLKRNKSGWITVIRVIVVYSSQDGNLRTYFDNIGY